jgi:hypothetical protein
LNPLTEVILLAEKNREMAELIAENATKLMKQVLLHTNCTSEALRVLEVIENKTKDLDDPKVLEVAKAIIKKMQRLPNKREVIAMAKLGLVMRQLEISPEMKQNRRETM